MSLQFFLYSDNEIANFFDYLGVYSKEIFDALKNHPKRSLDPHSARIFITCFSNETNYPVFGNQILGSPEKKLSKDEMVEKCCYLVCGLHLTFFHNSDEIGHPFVNIPYMSNSKEAVLICPPTPTNINFSANLTRHILVSFKGNFDRNCWIDGINYRNLVIKKCKRFESDEIIIGDSNYDAYSYKYLLHNSVFSLVIEGDLPWSYRLTEVLNSGSIPVIILPKHRHILPFQQTLDYSKFSILLNYDEIDTFFERLKKIDSNYIRDLQNNLYAVNQLFFLDRNTQFNSLLNCIEHSYDRNKFPDEQN